MFQNNSLKFCDFWTYFPFPLPLYVSFFCPSYLSFLILFDSFRLMLYHCYILICLLLILMCKTEVLLKKAFFAYFTSVWTSLGLMDSMFHSVHQSSLPVVQIPAGLPASFWSSNQFSHLWHQEHNPLTL